MNGVVYRQTSGRRIRGDALTDFLRSLTGVQPQGVYPTLPPSVATTPTPKS